jgi:hypothetical protein
VFSAQLLQCSAVLKYLIYYYNSTCFTTSTEVLGCSVPHRFAAPYSPLLWLYDMEDQDDDVDKVSASRMLTYAHVFYDTEDEADELDKVKRPSIASEERY